MYSTSLDDVRLNSEFLVSPCHIEGTFDVKAIGVVAACVRQEISECLYCSDIVGRGNGRLFRAVLACTSFINSKYYNMQARDINYDHKSRNQI